MNNFVVMLKCMTGISDAMDRISSVFSLETVITRFISMLSIKFHLRPILSFLVPGDCDRMFHLRFQLHIHCFISRSFKLHYCPCYYIIANCIQGL